MKSVVHIIAGLGRGGAEHALTRLLESPAVRRDYRHTVISLTDGGVYARRLATAGVPVISLGAEKRLRLPSLPFELIRRLRALKPDLVQTWMYHADLLGGLAAQCAGRPPVLWGIRSFDLKRGAKLPTRMVQKACAWTSAWLPTLILCVAEASRRNHTALGYEAGRIRVVPNGFEVGDLPEAERVQAFRAVCGLQPAHRVVGCVGRFHPAKDHRNFVLAAAQVAEHFADVRFMMVGPGLIWENRELRDWIEEAGLTARMVLLGEREDVPSCMAAMDVFCSSSRTEAFPQVVGEAMALAKPVVVTDVGDSALVVGDTGIVVAKEDPLHLAQGLMRLLHLDTDERVIWGQRARQRIRDEFSFDRTVAKTLSAYAEALSGHQQR
ncbi:glycosyltransferase [Chitiniphilus purpureus]|uniref:Glycosyltransferase n=1 Tax=Chitiniphilus purpureus TaxID=2981137 RepID=A0ABY6DJD1_9NEIS|nr:glycosyltransferase [Chitiniphilus sp. CD1]UXY14475.1 glycosyltransferase [Chitiniphilus sp. CD1]